MQIIDLTGKIYLRNYSTRSFALKLIQTKDIWLFNCFDGCQHYLMKYNIKINQICSIIITDLNTENISGLAGLLSSLSLLNRKRELHIYGPYSINKYISLIKKYSKTSFCYSLYCHILYTGLIVKNHIYQIYSFVTKKHFEFLIIGREKNSTFKLQKAQEFHISEGPLYGKLKQGIVFILPDGSIINGTRFVSVQDKGIQVLFLASYYINRRSIEIGSQANILYYLY